MQNNIATQTYSTPSSKPINFYPVVTAIVAGGMANVVAIPLSVTFVQAVIAASEGTPLTSSYVKRRVQM